MLTERPGNEISKEEICKELSLLISNGEKDQPFSTEVVAPDGMRIIHWDPIETIGTPTGSIVLSLKVQEGEQRQEKKSLQMAAFNVGATATTPVVTGQATFGGQVKKELDDLFTNRREKHTLQLVAEVAPIRNKLHMVTTKVNLAAKLKVYFGPIPQLTHENPGDRKKVSARPTIDGKLEKLDAGLACARGVPAELGEKHMDYNLKLVNAADLDNSPHITSTGEIKEMNLDTLSFDYNRSSGRSISSTFGTGAASLCSKQGLFAVGAVATAALAVSTMCEKDESLKECAQNTIKNMCTLL